MWEFYNQMKEKIKNRNWKDIFHTKYFYLVVFVLIVLLSFAISDMSFSKSLDASANLWINDTTNDTIKIGESIKDYIIGLVK